jgi:hypothetical protein
VADEIEQIVDINGNTRRLGSLAPDTGMLAAFAAAPGAVEEWTDEEIRKAITDPNRKPSRKMFDSTWMCDQLSYGSCNGWGTSGVIARGRYRRGFRDGLKKLSGSYMYAWMNGNQDNGSMLSDGLKVAEEHGAPPLSLVPANLIYRKQMPAGADAAAAKHKGFKLRPVKTIRGLRTALAKQWPCVVAVHAGGNFQRLDSNGIAGADNGRGNHSVCVDDLCIVAGKEVFDMANSWGVQYGQQGRAYLTLKTFEQTFGVHTFWTLPTTQEG